MAKQESRDYEDVLKEVLFVLSKDPDLKSSFHRIKYLDLWAHFVFSLNGEACPINHILSFPDKKIYDCALQNTRKDIVVSDLSDFVNVHGGIPIKFVSNKVGLYGASAMLFPDIFHDICVEFDTLAAFILPSSVHELLVVPVSAFTSMEEANNSVKHVNETVLCSYPDAILSDHAYFYDDIVGEIVY